MKYPNINSKKFGLWIRITNGFSNVDSWKVFGFSNTKMYVGE